MITVMMVSMFQKQMSKAGPCPWAAQQELGGPPWNSRQRAALEAQAGTEPPRDQGAFSGLGDLGGPSALDMDTWWVGRKDIYVKRCHRGAEWGLMGTCLISRVHCVC